MEYIDRNVLIMAIGAGVALGMGVFVAMDNNPIGLLFGFLMAAGLILSNYRQNRKKASS